MDLKVVSIVILALVGLGLIRIIVGACINGIPQIQATEGLSKDIIKIASIIAFALMVIGAFGIIFLKKPMDKVIMFTILDAGFILAVVLFKYLDVAMFAALVDPLSTLVFIFAIVKINEIRKKKLENGDLND